MLEMDFLGNQPSGVSQTPTFTNPTMRLRHAMFRVETPVVDVMVGQYWHLFGWMEGYLPNTTEIQGAARAALRARSPGARLEDRRVVRGTTFEMALAAVRPPALSEVPEGEAACGSPSTSGSGCTPPARRGRRYSPASIAVTGDMRYFEIPEAAAIMPTSMVQRDVVCRRGRLFLPILPARAEKHDNALSLDGPVRQRLRHLGPLHAG